MYLIAAGVISFVVIESVFFIVKAWRHGRKIGMSKETLKNVAVQSIVFTIAPALSILATVIVLASALGIVLPWIRLSVIGNLAYETVASETMLNVFGSSLTTPITEPKQFGAVAWVMTLGTTFALVLLPIFCKGIHRKVGAAVHKSEGSAKTADVLSAAAFIGVVAAFIARAVCGKTPDGVGDAGFMSIATLLTAVTVSLVLEAVCKKFDLKKLSVFAQPLAMFAAMGMALLLNQILPEAVTGFTWWNRL